jgi:FkbM family methyltransferase
MELTNEPSVQALEEFRSEGGIFKLPRVEVVRTTLHGEVLFFAIASSNDHIQVVHHAKGVFYEPEELEIIRRAFPLGGRFLDIGANVGNHALYVAKFLNPSEIIVVEPNPVAYRVLVSNVLLNQLEDIVDLNWIGFGISESEDASFGMDFLWRNIGGGKLIAGEGNIPTVKTDRVVGDRDVDFVKIDVEGMEMQVLRSMSETVARCKPRIFVEVDDVNLTEFQAWKSENNYESAATFRRYRTNENHLLVHREDEY